MIWKRVRSAVQHLKGSVLGASLVVLATLSCAGPQPLRLAIDPYDERAYVARLSEVNGDAATAYANWMANERSTTSAEILRDDVLLSETQNPFDAHHDPRAVSRGAVVYKIHCARCHGVDARGKGLSTLKDYPATNFKTFGKRFAATLHRGAPKKWFRVIRDGSGDLVEYTDERTTSMPAFGDKMTREQIWLVITYLQSLNIHASAAVDAENRR